MSKLSPNESEGDPVTEAVGASIILADLAARCGHVFAHPSDDFVIAAKETIAVSNRIVARYFSFGPAPLNVTP